MPANNRPDTGILIFEKSPYWGPELKRQFSGQSVLIQECRSVQDLVPAAEPLARAVVLLVLEAQPGDCLSWLTRRFQSESNVPIVVVSAPEFADMEWIVREAGVVSFVSDEVSGQRLARICSRLLRQWAAGERVAGPNGR